MEDKEYGKQRQEGKNWSEKMYLPKGGLEAELNLEEESKLARANWK